MEQVANELRYDRWWRMQTPEGDIDVVERKVVSTLEAENATLRDDRARLVAQVATLSEAVDVLKLVYRKHFGDDPSIGWDELGEKVLDALSNTMGVEELVKWQEAREAAENE